MKKISLLFGIITMAIAMTTTFLTGSPLAGLVCLAIGSFGFATSKAAGVLGMNTQYYDPSQLQLDEILDHSIKKAYGWEYNSRTGEWSQGNGDPIPSFDNLRLKKRSSEIIVRTFLTDKNQTLHVTDEARKNNGFSNVSSNTIGSNQIFVAFGVRLRAATGASNLTSDAIPFDTVTQDGINNGFLTVSMNDFKAVEDMPVENAFNSIPEIKSYFRFAEPKVIRPNNKFEINLKMAAVPATTWVETALVGVWIDTANSKG